MVFSITNLVWGHLVHFLSLTHQNGIFTENVFSVNFKERLQAGTKTLQIHVHILVTICEN